MHSHLQYAMMIHPQSHHSYWPDIQQIGLTITKSFMIYLIVIILFIVSGWLKINGECTLIKNSQVLVVWVLCTVGAVSWIMSTPQTGKSQAQVFIKTANRWLVDVWISHLISSHLHLISSHLHLISISSPSHLISISSPSHLTSNCSIAIWQFISIAFPISTTMHIVHRFINPNIDHSWKILLAFKLQLKKNMTKSWEKSNKSCNAKLVHSHRHRHRHHHLQLQDVKVF